MIVHNSTFFHGYNHLYHFHKANLIYHNYHNLTEYMEGVLPKLYGDSLKYIYLGDEVEFYKRTLLLDLRSTYLHSVETLFSLIAVLNKFSESLLSDPESINVFDELTVYDQHTLYTEIESYKDSITNLDFLDNRIADGDWSIGRFVFYAAYRPPNDKNADYLHVVNDSVAAIRTALQLFARDFGDRKEYNSYKHGLRVLDAFKSVTLLNPKSRQMLKMDLAGSLAYPVWNKKTQAMHLQTHQHDFERDHKMTLLAASLIRSIVTNRRIAYNDQIKGPDIVPQPIWSQEYIAGQAAPNSKPNVELLTLEEFERQNGLKVNLGRRANEPHQ